MLESVLRVESDAVLVALLFAAGGRCRSSTTAHGGAFELTGGAAGSFLAAINRVAEHFRDGFGAAQKVDLESVRLFLRARFGVNSPDV